MKKTLKNWCVEVSIEPLVRVLITDDHVLNYQNANNTCGEAWNRVTEAVGMQPASCATRAQCTLHAYNLKTERKKVVRP